MLLYIHPFYQNYLSKIEALKEAHGKLNFVMALWEGLGKVMRQSDAALNAAVD